MKLSDKEIKELLEGCELEIEVGRTPTTHNSYKMALKELQTRRKLDEYMQHTPGCNGPFPPRKCTCGLLEIQKELEGV